MRPTVNETEMKRAGMSRWKKNSGTFYCVHLRTCARSRIGAGVAERFSEIHMGVALA